MRSRVKFFVLHLALSSVVLGLLIAGFYFGWYRWPGWHLAGAELIVGLMVLVDIGVGPLATLVVASPGKSRRKLQWDMALIIVVQLVALGYGTKTLWDGRPLYYVFSASQIDLVPAISIDVKDSQVARERSNELVPEWYSLPRWVWARVPDDPEEFKRLLFEKLLAGGDVIAMPQYFHPYAEASAAMRAVYRPIHLMRGAPGLSNPEYTQRLASLGRAEESLGVLPATGRAREGAMIFDRQTGELVAYWPVAVPKSQ